MTILFTELVGFNSDTVQDAMDVVSCMNEIFSCFDEQMDNFDVYKVWSSYNCQDFSEENE